MIIIYQYSIYPLYIFIDVKANSEIEIHIFTHIISGKWKIQFQFHPRQSFPTLDPKMIEYNLQITETFDDQPHWHKLNNSRFCILFIPIFCFYF